MTGEAGADFLASREVKTLRGLAFVQTKWDQELDSTAFDVTQHQPADLVDSMS